MATNPIKRGILRKVLERPLKVGPGAEYRITPEGREMLFVAFVAERWLQSAPSGPLAFDSRDAEEAVGALVEGWSSTLMHELAREPLTLRELDRTIDGTSRRVLERHLVAMQSAGQVEARPREGAGAIYSVTDWLRAGIAPLAAAARLERRDPTDEMAPIAALDVEAAFLLTLPLLELSPDLSGTCCLGVDVRGAEQSDLVGVTAQVEAGRIVACSLRLRKDADAWASAPAGDWLDTVIEPDAKRVRTGGDRHLARGLLDGLHGKLFGVPVS